MVKTSYGVWKCPGCGYSPDSNSSIPKTSGSKKIIKGDLPVFQRIRSGHWTDADKQDLFLLLDHQDVNIRCSSITFLLKIEESKFIERLPEHFKKVQTATEKIVILEKGLNLRGNDPIIRQIISILISDLRHSKREIRVFSIARIKKMKIEEAVPELITLESDPDPEIRRLAMNARLKIQKNLLWNMDGFPL